MVCVQVYTAIETVMSSITLRYLAQMVANTAYLLSNDLTSFSMRSTATHRDRVFDGIDQLHGILDRIEQSVDEQPLQKERHV